MDKVERVAAAGGTGLPRSAGWVKRKVFDEIGVNSKAVLAAIRIVAHKTEQWIKSFIRVRK